MVPRGTAPLLALLVVALLSVDCQAFMLPIQSGVVRFGSYPYHMINSSNSASHTVTFSPQMASTPSICLFLTAVDVDGSRTVSIKLSASSISNSRFTARVSVSGNAKTWRADVGWVATSASKTFFQCGDISDLASGSSRTVKFSKAFARTPNTAVMLKDLSGPSSSRLRMQVDGSPTVTKSQITIKADASSSSSRMGFVWFAVDPDMPNSLIGTSTSRSYTPNREVQVAQSNSRPRQALGFAKIDASTSSINARLLLDHQSETQVVLKTWADSRITDVVVTGLEWSADIMQDVGFVADSSLPKDTTVVSTNAPAPSKDAAGGLSAMLSLWCSAALLVWFAM